MPGTLRLIVGDQLTESLPVLTQADRDHDTILMCEVMEEASYVPHHPQKIALIFSAMRHFARSLQDSGFHVRYIKLDDSENTGNFIGEIKRAVNELKPDSICVTAPSEYRVEQMLLALREDLPIPLEIVEDTRFLCARTAFAAWARGKKQLRMEFFYRDMRRQHHILMDDAGEPYGGRWNFDADNRAAPPSELLIPQRPKRAADAITQDVLALVRARFSHHFGTLEPFTYGTTRHDALQDLDFFIKHLLADFGTYQDAMLNNQPYLYHSLLSAYLNIGLLQPLEVCQRAQVAYEQGLAPLNSVEGFIRQILGWREYVRGIYWTYMPNYGQRNFLAAKRPLPALYWGGATQMNCLRGAVEHTKRYAYSHHIQRLMLTGNFALLAGLDVKAVQEWYLAVYADAFEWVEMPNTLGMALFGDGGLMASKPYAASGKYIKKMSNYCQGCRFNPEHTLEADACPFNALYWHFIDTHEQKMASNPRLAYTYATLRKMSPNKRTAITAKATELLELLSQDKL